MTALNLCGNSDYPRDLHGYGRTPPDPKWPNDAVVAVQFVLNYEEGSENSPLHGDPGTETFLSEIIGAASFANRHMSMESLYEYGSRAGLWRVLRAFERRQLPLTIFAVAMALERHREAAAAFVELGHEIASHGYRWILHQHMAPSEEREQIARAVEAIRSITGTAPVGWYTGRDSPQTRSLVVEHGGFLYDSDSYADDLPYWLTRDPGTSNEFATPHLVIPYTLDTNDMRFAAPQGFNSGDQFFTYLRDAFDVLYREGTEGSPKMLNVGLHCRIVGRPARIASLERFLDHVLSHDRVWVTRRIDIAQHWHRHHRPVNLS